MAAGPSELSEVELDLSRYQLLSQGQVLRLEKIPMELLILLAERKGQLVSREQIIQRLWGKDVFLDTEQGINTAIRKIRQALADDPEQPRFVQTVVGKGYRFVGPITIVKPTGNPGESSSGDLDQSTAKAEPGRRAVFWKLMVTGLALTGLAVFGLVWIHRPATVSAPHEKVRLVVLPFENLSGDPQKEYFSDGLTAEMITRLGELNPQQLGVIARTSAVQYKNSRKDVAQIGRELDVDYVVEGSARSEGSSVRVTAQLIQVKDGTHVWAHTYDGKMQDVLKLQREIAETVGNEIRVVITMQARSVTKSGPVNPEAYELYLKGQYFWVQRTEPTLRKGLEYFQQAVEKDPEFAPAHAGIALSYNLLEYRRIISPQIAYPSALSATKRALEIDPLCAEAHLALAYIRNHDEWNWVEGEIEAKRAIELNPNYSLSHHWYAYFLRETGRTKQSLDEMKLALELDPVSERINLFVAGHLINARKYSEAILQLRDTENLGFRSPTLYRMFAQAYEHLGEQDHAAEAYEMYLRSEGNQHLLDQFRRSLRERGYAEAHRSANRSEMQHVLKGLQTKNRGGTYVSPAEFAEIYASLGEKAQAYDWLERAYRERSSIMIELTFDDAFEAMRPEPRFQELLKRVGVPQYQE